MGVENEMMGNQINFIDCDYICLFSYQRTQKVLWRPDCLFLVNTAHSQNVCTTDWIYHLYDSRECCLEGCCFTLWKKDVM